MPGVTDVYASSAFQAAEITYEPGKVSPEALEAALDQAGYLGGLLIPEESSLAVNERERRPQLFPAHRRIRPNRPDRRFRPGSRIHRPSPLAVPRHGAGEGDGRCSKSSG